MFFNCYCAFCMNTLWCQSHMQYMKHPRQIQQYKRLLLSVPCLLSLRFFFRLKSQHLENIDKVKHCSASQKCTWLWINSSQRLYYVWPLPRGGRRRPLKTVCLSWHTGPKCIVSRRWLGALPKVATHTYGWVVLVRLLVGAGGRVAFDLGKFHSVICGCNNIIDIPAL